MRNLANLFVGSGGTVFELDEERVTGKKERWRVVDGIWNLWNGKEYYEALINRSGLMKIEPLLVVFIGRIGVFV